MLIIDLFSVEYSACFHGFVQSGMKKSCRRPGVSGPIISGKVSIKIENALFFLWKTVNDIISGL